MAPTIGRTVSFILVDGERTLPLVVTRVWSATTVNGILLTDGSNDRGQIPNRPDFSGEHTLWLTSITQGDSPGNWKWPERAET